MRHLLTDAQRAKHDEFVAFVAADVEPCAERWDREQALPASIVAALGKRGYLGATLPRDFGGQAWDVVTFGLLNEALGKGSSALTNVITVQAMVSMALLKWGTAEQRAQWLPPLASGEMIGAFALTEPGAGSSLRSLETRFTKNGDGFTLNGTKKWISCAQFSSLFLVFGKCDDTFAVCALPRDTKGIHIEPISGLMGFRAAGLAQVRFDNVHVPATSMVGKPGYALSHVAPVGLQYGRISTACSALGLLRGCFEDSVTHAASRALGDKHVGDIGMVRSLIARMGADLAAASGVCHAACEAEERRSADVYEQTLIAKYFTSRAAVRAASDAVQIRGASGVHESAAVSRYYRDAKIMEIIEGTTQIHEELLGKMFVSQAGRIRGTGA
ncbi:MAG TPA: acyl-CoA dehydrogenase family protein [Gemmatimonadaceae bacterium]|nr:acyl-CoA dehydrogenase family protein [Gemmatimonadaceae bacterium]